jgi:hypothetical protein
MPEPWHGINDPGFWKKPQPEPVDNTRFAATDNYQPQKNKEDEITAALKTAQFLPDDKTDYTKPCKIKIDIDGDKTGQVTFALWARYKGKEYDLQHQIKADSSNQQSTADLKLFYVDDHYNDINGEDPGAKVDYFAKISMRGAKPTTSELLTMPCLNGITFKVKLSSAKTADDVFLLCDSAGKTLDQKALKDGKKIGNNEYEIRFTKIPKDTKELTIKIEDKDKRAVGFDKDKVCLEK